MANYRKDTLASHTTEWIGSQGNRLVVTVSLEQSTVDYFGNGDYQLERDGLRISTTASIDNADQGMCYLDKLTGVPGATHKVGRIALSAERAAEIEAAIAALKNHPAWVAKIESDKRSDAANAAYDKRVDAINKMMSNYVKH